MNDLTRLISVAASLGLVGWLARRLMPLIDQWFAKLEAQTKSTLMLNLEKWAQQTVHDVEVALRRSPGPLKKEAAIQLLAERIRHNNITGYFPPEVISGYIEEAVDVMNRQKEGEN